MSKILTEAERGVMDVLAELPDKERLAILKSLTPEQLLEASMLVDRRIVELKNEIKAQKGKE